MTSKKTPQNPATQAQAESKLAEAQRLLKTATEKHEALIAVVSRVNATPAERRFAQSESKKVERELRDAKTMLKEAQASTPTTKAAKAG